MENEIRRLAAIVADLQLNYAQQNAKITSLEAKITQQEARKSQQEAAINQQQAVLNRLTDEIQLLRSDMASMAQELRVVKERMRNRRYDAKKNAVESEYKFKTVLSHYFTFW